MESSFEIPLPSTRTLPGLLTSPTTTGPATGYIVLLHGMASHMDHSFAPALAAHLCAQLQVHVVRYTARGPAPHASEPAFRYRISGASTDDTADLQAVVSHSGSLGLGPLLALVGHSRGANAVLFYASQHHSTHPLVCISPRFHMEGMLQSRIFSDAQRASLAAGQSVEWPTKAGTITVTPADAAELQALGTMGSTAAALPPATPLLLVHGKQDTTIPAADSEALLASRPGCTTLSLLKGKHSYEGCEGPLFAAVTAFLKAHCSAAAAAAAAAAASACTQ